MALRFPDLAYLDRDEQLALVRKHRRLRFGGVDYIVKMLQHPEDGEFVGFEVWQAGEFIGHTSSASGVLTLIERDSE